MKNKKENSKKERQYEALVIFHDEFHSEIWYYIIFVPAVLLRFTPISSVPQCRVWVWVRWLQESGGKNDLISV